MSFIITLARGISVELFATLAGASIVAISIVAGIMSKKETKKSTYKAINGYLGMGYFVSSLTIFVLGVVLTLILDSFEANLKKSLLFESINVGIRGVVLFAGILLLFGGIDALTRHFMERKFRLFPEIDNIGIWFLQRILPLSNYQTLAKQKKDELRSQIKLNNIDSKESGKLPSDQLKTASVKENLMNEERVQTVSGWKKAAYCIIYTIYFAVIAYGFKYYSTRPNYELIKNYILWYYIVVGIGWALSIFLGLCDNFRTFVKVHLKKLSQQEILIVIGSIFLSFPLFLFLANSSDTTKNILPATIQFNVIELSGVLGGIVLAAAAVGSIPEPLQKRFFEISRYLILSTVLLAFFTIFSYNANINVSNLTTAVYSGAAEWISVICFYVGGTFFFMGIIKLVVALVTVNKYLDKKQDNYE